MKMNLKYIGWIITCLLLFPLVSCDDNDDEDVSSSLEITTMVPLGDSSEARSGRPGELIRVEGFNIKDMDRIIVDNNIEVIFNPALNSNSALFFNVPFDFEKGSKFGIQQINFINKNGTSITEQFEIIQPEPSIRSNNEFEPEKADSGEELVVNGEWFINVREVFINEESIDFTVVSDKQIKFIFPEGPTETVELKIVTDGGEIARPLPIEGGFITRLLTDFDGAGVIEGDWVNYGDSKFRLESNLGVDGSIGGEIIWDNTGTLPFTGCTSEQSFAPVTTSTDAKNAFIVIDVNIIHPGTVLEFTLTDGQSDQWLAKPPSPEGTGWQTIEIPISTFGNGFSPDPSDQNDEDPNPSTITKVNVQISQEGDAAPIPSGYRFDNIQLKALEL